MITLSSFTSKPLTDLYARLGAFYAFSQDQLKERSKPGVNYVKMPDGMIAPLECASTLYEEKNAIIKKGMDDHFAAVGKKEIVMHALWNNECALTMTIDSAIADVSGYGLTEADVLEHFAEYHEQFKALNE